MKTTSNTSNKTKSRRMESDGQPPINKNGSNTKTKNAAEQEDETTTFKNRTLRFTNNNFQGAIGNVTAGSTGFNLGGQHSGMHSITGNNFKVDWDHPSNPHLHSVNRGGNIVD
jgi:hypothetical protein